MFRIPNLLVKSLAFVLISLFSLVCTVQAAFETQLIRLDSALAKEQQFIDQRMDRIEHLKGVQDVTPADQLATRYNVAQDLFEAYSNFVYDSAFSYAYQMVTLAQSMQDSAKLAVSKIRLGYTTMSAGMFKESFDVLSTVSVNNLDEPTKLEYYALMSRLLYDLSDYDSDGYYSKQYNAEGDIYVEYALNAASPDSYTFIYLNGLKRLRSGDIEDAVGYMERLLHPDMQLTTHQNAITKSSLSYLKILQGDTARAVELIVDAAIADIESATKETVALASLSEILFNLGEVEHAYRYINLAMDAAEWYGANQRKTAVGRTLAVIAANRVKTAGDKVRSLTWYSVLISLLSLATIVFGFVSYRQSKYLKKKDAELSQKNVALNRAVGQLTEANSIKEHYLSYYFDLNSDYIEKIDKVKKSIDRKLVNKQYDDISWILSKVNVKDERAALYNSFDKVFLQIFPTFVERFNALFPPEEQAVLGEDNSLSTELRIFALIRMGISDNEKLAKILGYSVNTVYAYKNRIKTKSLVPNDEFEDHILAIESV